MHTCRPYNPLNTSIKFITDIMYMYTLKGRVALYIFFQKPKMFREERTIHNQDALSMLYIYVHILEY